MRVKMGGGGGGGGRMEQLYLSTVYCFRDNVPDAVYRQSTPDNNSMDSLSESAERPPPPRTLPTASTIPPLRIQERASECVCTYTLRY